MSEWVTDRPPSPEDAGGLFNQVWERDKAGRVAKRSVSVVSSWWGRGIAAGGVAWALIDPEFPDKAPEWKHQACPSSKHGDVESVLEEAARITSGDRQASYGPPDQDFTRTAAMWTALFGHEFSSSDVALAMIALKLSRQTHQHKRDNWVDIAGYAHCGAICDEC